MQFVFARRGRRVFQRWNLQQTAALSTRVSPPISIIRRVARLSNIGAPAVSKSISPSTSVFANSWVKGYATATAGRGRPKKHTGRETAKQSSTKTQKKPKKKKATKAKPKAKPKRILTVEEVEKKKAKKLTEKRKEEVKRLKEESLKDKEPKAAPYNAWSIYLQQRLRGNKDADKTDIFRTLASEFKNLSSSERETYDREAERNKEENARVYEEWVNTHTPLQIKTANHARRRLALLTEDKKYPTKLQQIRDGRQVKRPSGSFILFFTERSESGDLKHMTAQERAAHVKAEFDNLSQEQKEKYTRLAEQDKERYFREYREAYGEEPESLSRKAGASP